jgi:hypothetical protein
LSTANAAAGNPRSRDSTMIVNQRCMISSIADISIR